MESAFKFRISRMFRSSFGLCRSRYISDVVEQPVFVAQDSSDFDLLEPLSPKIHSQRLNESKEVLRRKISDTGVYFISGEKEGRTCPPASPISPLHSLHKLHGMEKEERKEKVKKTKKPHYKNKKKDRYKLNFSSCDANNNGWFSSEDETEDETERFFSSRSISSDTSSTCLPPRRRGNTRSKPRRRAKKKIQEMGICPLVSKGVVEESVAVVKRSSDPYSDFRTSMVEMIIEKQIFSAKDLERLLQCFLTLNSPLHHSVIVEVFTEIWEALFSNLV